jgi:hypothetical protein
MGSKLRYPVGTKLPNFIENARVKRIGAAAIVKRKLAGHIMDKLW